MIAKSSAFYTWVAPKLCSCKFNDSIQKYKRTTNIYGVTVQKTKHDEKVTFSVNIQKK